MRLSSIGIGGAFAIHLFDQLPDDNEVIGLTFSLDVNDKWYQGITLNYAEHYSDKELPKDNIWKWVEVIFNRKEKTAEILVDSTTILFVRDLMIPNVKVGAVRFIVSGNIDIDQIFINTDIDTSFSNIRNSPNFIPVVHPVFLAYVPKYGYTANRSYTNEFIDRNTAGTNLITYKSSNRKGKRTWKISFRVEDKEEADIINGWMRNSTIIKYYPNRKENFDECYDVIIVNKELPVKSFETSLYGKHYECSLELEEFAL
jgi:hypothetical protein